MKAKNAVTLIGLTLGALVFAGCADEDAPRVAPSLGRQIDRLGRPAVNTALIDAFFTDTVAHGAIQDGYNGASNPDQWNVLYRPQIAAHLAIYDSLDTVCGNQLLAGPAAVAGRYDGLAGALADDRLWVNSASGTCGVYLAVEANATGVIPNGDCGGRTPLYDVIDVSYSAFAIGAIAGVTDGIPADADPAASLTNFPFLADPR